jgi:hypothetical protein
LLLETSGATIMKVLRASQSQIPSYHNSVRLQQCCMMFPLLLTLLLLLPLAAAAWRV